MSSSSPPTSSSTSSSYRYFKLPIDYDFYATPDGDRCLEKTLHYAKYGAIAGGLFSFLDMGFYSRPRSYLAIVGRMLHIAPPWAAACAAFGVGVCFAAKIRQEDDFYNHAFGTAAATSVMMAKFHNGTVIYSWAVLIGATMMYIKWRRMNNVPMFVGHHIHKQQYFPIFDGHIKFNDDPGRPVNNVCSDE